MAERTESGELALPRVATDRDLRDEQREAERERQEREIAELYAEFMQREQDDEGEAEELGDGIDEPEEEVSRKRTSHSYDAR